MKRSGFTLIELMIVVAIIGIVAAIVLPIFMGTQTAEQPQNGTVVQSTRFECKQGFLFKVDGTGNATPATDSEARATKC